MFFLTLAPSLSLRLSFFFFSVSLCSSFSLFAFFILPCVSLYFPVPTRSVSHIRSLSLWLSLFLSLFHARAHTHTHTHTRWDVLISKWKKGQMPAQFDTTSLVTKRADIAARFVTLVIFICSKNPWCCWYNFYLISFLSFFFLNILEGTRWDCLLHSNKLNGSFQNMYICNQSILHYNHPQGMMRQR